MAPWLFYSGPCSHSAQSVDCFPIFSPFACVCPGILTDREDADTAPNTFDMFNEVGHIVRGMLRDQIEPVAADDVHSGVDKKTILRLLRNTGGTPPLLQLAHAIWNVVVLQRCDQSEIVVVVIMKSDQVGQVSLDDDIAVRHEY